MTFVDGVALEIGWADARRDLTELIFSTVRRALDDAGRAIEEVDSVVIAAHDLVDGRSLSTREPAMEKSLYRLTRGWRRLRDVLSEDRDRICSDKRRMSSERFIHDASQRVDIAPAVDVAFANRLLRAHVIRRSDCHACHRQAGRCCFCARFEQCAARDSEIRQHRMSVSRKQNIFRFYVAVNHAFAVSVVERVSNLSRDSDDVFNSEAWIPVEAGAQGFPVDVRHDEIQRACGFARIVKWQNERMTKSRENFDLAIEALGAECGALFGVENFESDRTFVTNVAGKVDSRHSTLPELAFESVAAGEGVAQIRGNAGRIAQFLVPVAKSLEAALPILAIRSPAGEYSKARRPFFSVSSFW